MKKNRYRYILLLAVFLSVLVYFGSCFTKQNSQRYLLVDSDSMLPTIYPGDYVLSDSIIGNGRLDYGDIVRFERVGEFTGEPYLDISRVVGLPGDSIGLVDNIIYINGKISKNKYIGKAEYRYKIYNNSFFFEEYEEILANNFSIKIHKSRLSEERDNAIVIYVPADHYYLIGDNRIMAIDSRFDGPYHVSKIIGKIVKIKSMH